MTFEEMKNLSKEKQQELFNEIKKKRQAAKTTLYAATYGAFPPKIARTANISLEMATILHTAYWKRNWAITKVVERLNTKLVDGQKWLFNPVSRFWYSLRSEKDKFSTLNQGTGSYCFDTWLSYVLPETKQITAQFHDEGVWIVREGQEKYMEQILRSAIDKANKELKLNKQLDIDVKFGEDYGKIH